MRNSPIRGAACGLFLVLTAAVAGGAEPTVALRGVVRDSRTREPLPARVYLRGEDGAWHFARSDSPQGSAVEYRVERLGVVEQHTTLSAHPFRVDVPPGTYTLTVERGKEYLPVERTVEVGTEGAEVAIDLVRWIDMAGRGWYSGDTHVHRPLADLPNVMLAEDLNVALPLTYWVTRSHTPPAAGDKNTGETPRPEPIAVDATHVIWPINTEYEIFTVQGKPHTLGAVFVLNHRQPLSEVAPPVGPIAAAARQQGAILDLDKHSWPWSLMLVPAMEVDLFELANNHCWRAGFGFSQWSVETLPAYMQLETTPQGFTEWGWIDFGLQTYYALLNCGFRMRPSAGTASGVHPVPLGFGRVYVHLPGGLDYPQWIEGLNAGRSFVTTGPMLLVEFAGRPPGHTFENAPPGKSLRIAGSVENAAPLDRIEIVANGKIVRTLKPANSQTELGGYRSAIEATVTLDRSGWLAVRAIERRADGRVRFAHSAPVHVDVPGQPLAPRKAEVQYLVRRMEEELSRNREVLAPAELDEYRQALKTYQALLDRAEDE